MSDLLNQLRMSSDPLTVQAAQEIQTLRERTETQQTIMNKAASILAEAISSDDDIDGLKADACIDLIRGKLAEVGKTTAEHFVDLL